MAGIFRRQVSDKEKIVERNKQEKKLEKWWKNKTTNYNPIVAPILKQRRDAQVLQALAASEYYDSVIICRMNVKDEDANNYCLPGTGYIYLNFKRRDSERYKKIVAMHEARHLNVTPSFEELTEADVTFIKNNRLLVNILEDVRINRSVCLKYPGMTRYYDSELGDKNNEFISLGVGDLVNKELTDIPEELEVFFNNKEEIRACVTYQDVLKIARKMVQQQKYPENQTKGEEESDSDETESGGSLIIFDEMVDENEDESSDGGTGISNEEDEDEQDEGESGGSGDKNQEEDEDKPIKAIVLSGGLTENTRKKIEEIMEDDDQIRRIINIDHKEMYQTNNVEGDNLKTVKKNRDFFLGAEDDDYDTLSLSKNKIRLLSRDYQGWKRTREGRLNKINLSKLYTDCNAFKRRYVNRSPPKVYIVLDGSGSMGSHSRSWQKGLTVSLTDLFKTLNIEYQIFIHSGTHGEFYYSEILDEDIPKTGSYLYTLDGSMLENLFEKEINPKERAIIFYFSDGHIPAQYQSIQIPLVDKYNRIAEQRGTPIFGIGLNATGVDLFKHYYIVKTNNDFSRVLEEIGEKLNHYM